MDQTFAGQNVLITCALGTLGQALVARHSKLGARVYARTSSALVVLVLAGCGAQPTTDTGASTAAQPSSSAPALEQLAVSSPKATLGSELPIVHIEALEIAPFKSVEDMARESSEIVAGVVTSVESLGISSEESLAVEAPEFLLITVAVETRVKGDPAKTSVSFVWEGFMMSPEKMPSAPLDTSGVPAAAPVDRSQPHVRTSRVVFNGVSTPDLGDQLLLFLTPISAERADYVGVHHSFDVNPSDGLLYIVDGVLVTEVNGNDRVSRTLIGRSVDDVTETLAAFSRSG